MAKIKHDMTQGSVVKNLLLFSLPLFLSYFFQALYGSVDTLIVGQFCELADVTGVTQGSQITHILTGNLGPEHGWRDHDRTVYRRLS